MGRADCIRSTMGVSACSFGLVWADIQGQLFFFDNSQAMTKHSAIIPDCDGGGKQLGLGPSNGGRRPLLDIHQRLC